MLTEEQLNKYADVLIWGLKTARQSAGGEFGSGDIVTIACDIEAMKLVEILHTRAIREEWNIEVKIGATDNMIYNFYNLATDKQLGFIMPWAKLRAESIDGFISISAENDLFNLENIDPKRLNIGAIAQKPIRDILDKKEAIGRFGWSLAILPTIGLASQAKMSLREYTDQIVKACYLDQKDPVRAWTDLRKETKEIRQWLWNLDIESVHIESKNTDLKIGIGEGRVFIGVSGHNIPSFEIFTSPDWRLVNGTFYADATSFRSGKYVRGVKLVFENGEVISAIAEEGEEFLQAQLDTDKGSKRVGEFSMTDRRHSKIDRFMANTLFDENYGGKYGNSHIALGKSFTDCYKDPPKLRDEKEAAKLGFNDSAIHWDFVNQENRTITATLSSGNKKIIYDNGEFKL